jgi:regulator of protease activity HflC (stomatin/prohibitin superfamily)
VIDSINATAQAQQHALKIQNEVASAEAEGRKSVATAEAEARAAIAAAEGKAKSTLLWAEAEASANKKIADSLTPNFIELRRIDKWNGALPSTMPPGGTVPFITIK